MLNLRIVILSVFTVGGLPACVDQSAKPMFDCSPTVVQNRTAEDQQQRTADFVIEEARQAKANCR